MTGASAYRYLDAMCLPTPDGELTPEAIREMQLAMLDALRSDAPLPTEMRPAFGPCVRVPVCRNRVRSGNAGQASGWARSTNRKAHAKGRNPLPALVQGWAHCRRFTNQCCGDRLRRVDSDSEELAQRVGTRAYSIAGRRLRCRTGGQVHARQWQGLPAYPQQIKVEAIGPRAGWETNPPPIVSASIYQHSYRAATNSGRWWQASSCRNWSDTNGDEDRRPGNPQAGASEGP